jgi:hypothetical protein
MKVIYTLFEIIDQTSDDANLSFEYLYKTLFINKLKYINFKKNVY